jgi:hypothetical protein
MARPAWNSGTTATRSPEPGRDLDATHTNPDAHQPVHPTQNARLLDENWFVQRLALVTADINYRMPLRINQEKKDGSDGVDDEMSFFEENNTTLSSRIARLGTKSAWTEDPPLRCSDQVDSASGGSR